MLCYGRLVQMGLNGGLSLLSSSLLQGGLLAGEGLSIHTLAGAVQTLEVLVRQCIIRWYPSGGVKWQKTLRGGRTPKETVSKLQLVWRKMIKTVVCYLQVKAICPAHPCLAPGPLWVGVGEGKRHFGAGPPLEASLLEKGPPPHWNIIIKTVKTMAFDCLHKGPWGHQQVLQIT